MEKKLQKCLLFLRLTVFLVLFVWTLDKFIRPEHASAVFQNFYYLPDLGELITYILGAFELFIIFAFLLGIQKRWSYGFVLLFHTISTLSSYNQYLDPFATGPNLLFFAAWPMLAACTTLYAFQKEDTLLQISS